MNSRYWHRHALTAVLLAAPPAAAQSVPAQLDPAARVQRNAYTWAQRDGFRLVDSIAEAEFAKDSLGSITVAVVNGREMLWSKSYGFTDRERKQRATPATVYRIASVTKQFTAIALMQLVDRKVVRLSDPVDQYVPEIRTVRGLTRPPSLVQLATMTSGLARDPADKRASAHGQVEGWMGTLFSGLLATEAVSEPGVAYRYSNVGYAVLGAAISRAANTPFVDYVGAKIIRPLGMTSTDFVLSAAMRQRLATGVDYDVLVKDSLNYEDAANDHRNGYGLGVPSGGLYSTIGDLAKLVSLELGFGPDSVLSPAALAVRNAVPLAADPTIVYGYGLGTQTVRWSDTTATGHSGNLSGYTSQIYYDRARGFGVIVLRSAGGGEADASRLAGRAFRKLVSLERAGPP
ncbi:MAG TPA: serine hydrolase domain-containing protein [Gemmatimonadaceae bacterium]|nr:serine hydrolase domain-containing protein [Gemmatimonadaceae bacterium]